MKASIAAVAASVIVVVGCWFGWGAYQAHLESADALQSIQTSTVLFERQISARDEEGITVAEYTSRASSVLESLDKESFKLATREWDHRSTERDIAVAYINECKTMTRLASSRVRLLVEDSSAQKAYDEAKKQLDEATSTQSEWRYKRYSDASDNLLAILQKKIEASKEAKLKAVKLLAADDSVKSAFGESKGLSKPVADDFRKSVSPEKSKDDAEKS